MTYDIKPIKCTYKQTFFKSKLEARWAYMFDRLGWKWAYEPYNIGNRIPDFIIKNSKKELIIEIKPTIFIDKNWIMERLDKYKEFYVFTDKPLSISENLPVLCDKYTYDWNYVETEPEDEDKEDGIFLMDIPHTIAFNYDKYMRLPMAMKYYTNKKFDIANWQYCEVGNIHQDYEQDDGEGKNHIWEMDKAHFHILDLWRESESAKEIRVIY